MKMVMGALNGVRLQNLMTASAGKCSRATAAVAYATANNGFFEHCLSQGIYVEYFGLLDEDDAVSIPVLEKLVEAAPLQCSPRLLKGHFHSKIIWWHGYGVYIGSANLTNSAWTSNVECGIFYEEDEVLGTHIQTDLESQFSYLRKHSGPVTRQLIDGLKRIRPLQAAVNRERQKMADKFAEATKEIPTHVGLASGGKRPDDVGFTNFTQEWNETLDLLRNLAREFHKLDVHPKWIAPDVEPAVHFDQFLHAFYYDLVKTDRNSADNSKSVEVVNRAFELNRSNPRAALERAAKWWSALPVAPYDEDDFMHRAAPMIRGYFLKDRLPHWSLRDFQNVFFEVHAFKMHARQVKNKYLDLPVDHKTNIRERSDLVAARIWNAPREATQKSILEMLQFLIWGSNPSSVVERLYMAVKDDDLRFERLGQSSLGEAVGWARPDLLPPRNNRTNKALRCLGHPVTLFSD
jgi:hypothetical protein